jgi:hypothetical protein
MMKRLMFTLVAGLLLCGTIAAAPAAQGRGAKHAQKGHSNGDGHAGSDVSVGIRLTWGKADVAILRDHYAPRYRNLPPGLQKKVARGRPLPPGWQKKFEPFPVVLERQLPSLPRDHRRGVIDGHAVIYNSRTNVIVDVAVLF